MKNKLFFLFLMLCAIFSAFSQNSTRSDSINNASRETTSVSLDTEMGIMLMLARSSVDYRVTPGDIYTLVYTAGNNQVTYPITVDNSYRIRVSNLGFVNGAGKTFLQIKSEIETIVSNNYPLSGVQLIFTQPALFNVFVRGEVSRAIEVPVWGLSRLSSIIRGEINWDNNTEYYNARITTPFTSLRDISILSSNGQTRIFDLFKSGRLGDLSQDPYLRPGDIITFNKVKRVVTIIGSVERSGTYQLLDGENIRQLIEYYGSGFTLDVDRSRIELVRLANNEESAGVKFFLSVSDLENDYELENLDVITVPSISQLQAVIFVEGAINAIQDLSTSNLAATEQIELSDTEAIQNPSASNRIIVRFNKGETYSSLVRRNIGWFSAVSDTQNAYILRGNERLPINLDNVLYDASYRTDIFVVENDVLIIPFRQYFVSVAGAVAIPGRYPYIPDRDWEYYIGLAGGFDSSRNSNNSLTIVDINGNRMNKTDIITPETTITANTNHFLFYFNQYAPVITTTLSMITTIFTILTYLSR